MDRLLGFLVAGVIIGWGVVTSLHSREPLIVRGKEVPRAGLSRPRRLVGALWAGIVAYYLLTSIFLLVPGAHVACVYDPTRGGIQDATIPEGLHVIPPLGQHLHLLGTDPGVHHVRGAEGRRGHGR